MNTWKPIITMDYTSFDKEICNLKKQRYKYKKIYLALNRCFYKVRVCEH